jgi:hypothetical protein
MGVERVVERAVERAVDAALAPTGGWADGVARAWLATDVARARAEAVEALEAAPDPAAAARDLARALRPGGATAPDGAPVALAREARGELLVERDDGEVERLAPDLEARLERAAARVIADDLRARVVAQDTDGQALVDLAQARAASRAASAVARARGALERARVALLTKPPLVLDASWCVDVARLPVPLQEDVSACAPQAASWAAEDARLPARVVDTRLLPGALAARVVAALGPLDVARAGLLVEGDNARALRLLTPRLTGEVQCAYLDPPFNTASDGFAYADRLPSALWLAALDERLGLVAPLLRGDGALFAHIDGHEKERLRLLLDEHLHHVTEIIWRIGWISGFKSRAQKFIRNHDTLYHYGRSPRPLFVKHYLPYPPGYVRRDGKPPSGAGYPLEDTWNCSEMDRLDSIQLKSFSREKVGHAGLTQKNEDLLERVLLSSSRPGDLVLDPYLGSGTTAAVAHKTGRRWVGIERGAAAGEYARPRLVRVLAGDPRGVSARHGWKGGGGAFQTLRLESAELTLANVLAPGERAAPGQVAYTLEGGVPRLDPAAFDDPLAAWLRGPGGTRVPVDLSETFSWLLGVRVERVVDVAAGRAVIAVDAAGGRSIALWPRASGDAPALLDLVPPDGAGTLFVPEGAGVRRAGWVVHDLAQAFGEVLLPAGPVKR